MNDRNYLDSLGSHFSFVCSIPDDDEVLIISKEYSLVRKPARPSRTSRYRLCFDLISICQTDFILFQNISAILMIN